MKRIRFCLLIGGVVAVVLACAGSALAAPVTVKLRIEGPTTTLFEGRVTTDVRTFHFTGDATQHQCDGTTLGGSATSPQPTRGAAVMAATDQGLTITGSFGSFGASFQTINGVNVDFNPTTNEFLAEYLNGQFASVGACSDPVKNGDDVLFAYNDGSQGLLGVTGPATALPDQAAIVHVVDLGSGAAVVGAAVDGHQTDASGNATIGPYDRGDHALKATKTGFVRSNALKLCVTDGADGFCGTTKVTATTTTTTSAPPPPATAPSAPVGAAVPPDTTPPVATIASIANGKKYPKGHGPRTLQGTADDPGSGIDHVSLRLVRKVKGHCSTFLPSKAKFAGIRCGASNGVWFKVGSNANWSYLLPSGLPSGSYTLDVRVTDRAHNHTTALDGGKEHVSFTVA